MNDDVLDEKDKKWWADTIVEYALEPSKEAIGRILGFLPAADDLPEIVLSDEIPPDDIYTVSLEDVRKWAGNIKNRPSRDNSLPSDLCDALRRLWGNLHNDRICDEGRAHGDLQGNHAVGGDSLPLHGSYEFASLRLGEYDYSQRKIIVYYRNHPSFAKWRERKGCEDENTSLFLKVSFLSEVCGTFFHEYLHHLHYTSFGDDRLLKSPSWKKDVVCESLADYFSYACLKELDRAYEREFDGVFSTTAERRRESWERYYGSPWPYAYALLIAEHPDRDKRFKEVYDKSLSDWNEAYALLTEGKNIKPFAGIRKRALNKKPKRAHMSESFWRNVFFYELEELVTLVEEAPVRHCPSDSFSFMRSASESKTELARTDVTERIQNGGYGFETPFLLFFLYDLNDETARDFIEGYGGKLHTFSSDIATILTFFDRRTVGMWGKNVHHPEAIRCNEKDSDFESKAILSELKQRFGVSSLPALVLAKKGSGGADRYASILLEGLDARSLFVSFKGIIDILKENCGEDWGVLLKKLPIAQGSAPGQGSFANALRQPTFSEFIEGKIEAKGLKREDIAADFSLCNKTFYNRRVEASFTREECQRLARMLDLDQDDFDRLLRYCGHPDCSSLLTKGDLETMRDIQKRRAAKKAKRTVSE